LNILHITPAYFPATYWGGPIVSVYALNNALARFSDVTLKVVTTDAAGPEVSDRLDVSGVLDLYSNQEVYFNRRVAGACVSGEMLRKLPALVGWADVVHLTGTYSFPTIPTLLICRAMRKPLVWSPRGAIQDAEEWEGARRRGLKRLWEKFCNALIRAGTVVTHTTSEQERRATEARIPKATSVVVPNGVDVPEVLAQREWASNGRLRLMYLGRLAPKKGVENLLQAMGLLKDPNVSLTIYGSGKSEYTTRLKSLTGQLGLLGSVVFFAGHIEGEMKGMAFSNADVCVVPSHSENFCMVIAESLAHGVPVIASRGTPWREIESRGCGLWVDNGPEALAAAIRNMRARDLSSMGAIGRHWMKADFSWESVARTMLSEYRRIYASTRFVSRLQ
jgi:glycosyltransferase involved in cell wall biosynthesis